MEATIKILWQLFQIGFLTIGVIGFYMLIYAIVVAFYKIITDKD